MEFWRATRYSSTRCHCRHTSTRSAFDFQYGDNIIRLSTISQLVYNITDYLNVDMPLKLRSDIALTFDDVLLVPCRSSVRSRQAVNTYTRFSRNIEIAIPIVSSNMDTVTESAMAIAMARAGGLGVIHRFMTVERQATEIAYVKQARISMIGKSH